MATEMEQSWQLAGFVADQLRALTGEPWAAVQANHEVWASLENGEGAHIMVRFEKDRVEFIGKHPKNSLWPEPEKVSIKANRYKAPDVLAKDLVKRHLPKYLPEVERVSARVTKELKDFESRRTVTDLLAGICHGVKMEDDSVLGHEARFSYYYNHNIQVRAGNVRVSNDGTEVEVELRRLTVAQAEAILKAANNF